MSRSIREMFLLLDSNEKIDGSYNENLFGLAELDLSEKKSAPSRRYEQADIDLVSSYFSQDFNISVLCEPARLLFEFSIDASINAFDIFIHAWMSELPIEAETISFGRRVIAAAQAAGGIINEKQKRVAAAMAAADCGDEDTLAVLNAAAKVQNEIHKMRGLLRFFPENDVYISKCAPDHFILPALGEYFSARFGETAWIIIDEKRGLCLNRRYAQDAKILFYEECPFAANRAGDEWEELWRHYHKTINNESRKNPSLQRQFMPKRYWKYLNEL
jgi:probable DNA metabolism protein